MESRGRQRERGGGPGNCIKSRKGISKSILGKIECWNCDKRGHLKKDCRDPKRKGDTKQETNHEANVAGDVLQDTLILALDNNSEAKSKKCTFIGYGVDDFGYRLWDLKNCKIIRSRDVVFNEKVMYKDQLQGKKVQK